MTKKSRIEGTLNRSFALRIEKQHRAADSSATAEGEGASATPADNLVLSFPFASEEPYLRSSWFDDPWMETLGVTDAECDLTRLNAGAAVMANHGRYSTGDSPLAMIGKTLRAWIDIGRAYVEIKLSRREGMDGLLQDIADELVPNVSVGYQILERTLIKSNGETAPDEYRVTKWLPLEVTLCDIPADATVGIGRSIQTEDAAEGATHYRVVDLPEPGASTKGMEMGKDTQTPGAGTPTATATASENETQVRAAVEAERQRGIEIREACALAGLEPATAEDFIKRGITADAVRQEAMKKMAERSAAQNVTSRADIVTVRDETETRREMAGAALLHRYNPKNALPEGAREFRGLTLLELARDCLERQGVKTRGMDKMEIARRAFEGTSDLANIVANVANKTLRQAYQTASRSFTSWAREASAADFKTISRVALSDAPALETVNENGEFKRGAVTDGKETYQLATVGKIIGITRQVIINDDLSAFTRLPQLFANAAANYESDTVYGILTANAALADNVALFEASTHKNYTASGTAISVTSLDVGRATMRVQKTPQSVVMNLGPRFLIVPAAKETIANQYTSADFVSAKSSDINPFKGALDVIVEGRLDASSTTAWYLAADPATIDTVEYCYLEGQQGVYLETRQGFEVDGMELKARLDFAAKAIDYRGLYKNVGA
ncbi:MAG: prohead protease/major capsid protein fusion protein [Sterolibacterium sp.]